MIPTNGVDAGARGPTSRTRRLLFIAVTLVLVCGLPVLGAEALLQVLNRPSPIVSGWRASQQERYRLQLNELGSRGVPIEYSPDDFVIVLVGDSQVEAAACSYAWLPERRLEHYLSRDGRVRVFSLAAGGWGQDQELLSLREYYEEFRADLVIVWLTPRNDIWNNTFPTMDPEGRQPKPTFWLEEGQLHGPTTSIGEVVSSRFRLLTAYQKYVASPDAVWERRLPAPYVPQRDYQGPVNLTWQTLWDQQLGNIASDNLATEKSHQTIYLTPRSPRTQYGIDLTHRLLLQMASETSARGGSFMTFWVDTPSPEVDLDAKEEAVFVLNESYYRLAARQMLATMAEVNAGFDSHVVPPPSGDWRVSPTDGHLNEHAVDDVMAELARLVAGQLRGS